MKRFCCISAAADQRAHPAPRQAFAAGAVCPITSGGENAARRKSHVQPPASSHRRSPQPFLQRAHTMRCEAGKRRRRLANPPMSEQSTSRTRGGWFLVPGLGPVSSLPPNPLRSLSLYFSTRSPFPPLRCCLDSNKSPPASILGLASVLNVTPNTNQPTSRHTNDISCVDHWCS